MNSEDKLVLYKGILLGRSGNSLISRFKLMRVVRDNNVDELYVGERLDNITQQEFENKEIIRSDWSDALIFAPGRGTETVFRHCDEDGYYYDVLDMNTRCVLIDTTVMEAEHGCCNLKELGFESVVARVKVKNRRNR